MRTTDGGSVVGIGPASSFGGVIWNGIQRATIFQFKSSNRANNNLDVLNCKHSINRKKKHNYCCCFSGIWIPVF
ncbi:unnamed protein product [Allacma fusca]|uniref:Uncharacterized protein n=1 Tax=Allacma fusca TaxID=39272 RepID=A0A8J2J689_9HEXA|nr:unnamed protein product [Allacma fusca]